MKYNVLYVDPPWEYKNKKTGGRMSLGVADKYPTMSINELKALNLSDVLETDCVLFLWSTVPMLPLAFELISTWGFQYKTMLTWRKIMSWGMGFWFRGQTEHLLLAIKGKIKAFRAQRANFLQTKALRHSEKPEEFRELIEFAVSNSICEPKYLELFATKKILNWDCVGFEANGQDVRDFLNERGKICV